MNLATQLFTRPAPFENRAGLVALYDTFRTDDPVKLPTDFVNYAAVGFHGNAPIRAVLTARARLFTEIRFKWRNDTLEPRLIANRDVMPGELYRTDALRILENPWPNGTTGDLLALMIQDADLSGNAFIYKASPTRLQRLRPDWVTIHHNNYELIGYTYTPGGVGSKKKPVPIIPEEMAHWILDPHPTIPFLGTTWMTALAKEVNLDYDMQRHKGSFFRNAATPNLILKFAGRINNEQRDALRDEVQRRYEGADRAYKTMLLEGGADVVSVGHSFKEADFARIQDAGETRIASASGVPPVLVGFNSGLQAATYSNYLHAMRRFADATLRPLWRSAADALNSIVQTRTGDPLDFDDRDVPALQQDAKDDAEILQLKASTMSTLITAGYEPDAVARAVMSGRLETLTHTGNIPTSLYNTDGEPETPEPGDDFGNNGPDDGEPEE